MTNLKKLLTSLNACEEAVSFANGKELSEAWSACERADWMLWLVGRMVGSENWPTRKQIVAVACSIAEDVLPIFEKKYPNDKRPHQCLETIRAYLRDEATLNDVKRMRADAAYAAYTAYTADAAYAADAADAAYAAAYTAYTAAYAADAAAAAAAAYAAYTAYIAADAAAAAAAAAAADAAADAAAAWNSTRDAKLKEYADLVRRELKIPVEVAQ